MATIDFNILRSEGPQNLYEGFLQGQKAVSAEQERNMLRQSQMQQMEAQRENILAQREQRLAQASQQQSAEAGRRRRQEVLGRLSSSFEANGLTLDRKTLGEMYKAGLELGDNTLITTATTGLKALDDEDRDKAEMARFGLGPAPAAPTAPAPANAFTVPSLAEGAAPAPVNAMVDRGRVQQMIMSPSPRVRQMGQALAGTLEKPEASPADVRAYEYARGQGFTGSFFDFKRQLAEASRAPAQPREPAAPTITQIQDPTNPNQMITINARVYQGGGVGSPGVIGTTGKTPAATAAEQKREEGKTQLQNDLDNLRSAFTELNQRRAIPSTERGGLSNLISSTQASAPGQLAGRAFGTKEQVERDVINSARQRLVASIKNATGMSSKSLDSNMELQTMLRSLSDPSQAFEAAIRIIDDIEDLYVRGGGAKGGAPSSSGSSAPASSKIGGGAGAGKPGTAPAIPPPPSGFVPDRPR